MSSSLKRRKSKRKAEKALKLQRSVLVRTIFGTSILDVNSQVSVKIGDQFIQKRARELKKGEDVLFAKKGVGGISLEQAEEALLKSPRYAATAPMLFAQGTTAFNYHLRSGLGLGLKDEPGEAGERIREKLAEGEVMISLSHIRNGWLGGKVIAPREKDRVFSLVAGICPDIEKIMSREFDDAYRLYTTIRRTTMQSISLILRGKGSGSGGSSGTIDARPEIRLVAEHFASDISTEHATVNVLDVLELRTMDTGGSEQGVLFRGITGDAPPRKKDPAAMLLERLELTAIFRRTLFEFLAREMPEMVKDTPIVYKGVTMGRRHKHSHEQLPEELIVGCIPPLMGYSEGKESNREFFEKARKSLSVIKNGGKIIDQLEGSFNDPAEEYREAARRFVAALHGGSIDRVYGFESGLVLAVWEYHTKSTFAIPAEFNDMNVLDFVVKIKKRFGAPFKADLSEFERIRKKLVGQGYVADDEISSAFSKAVRDNLSYRQNAERLFGGDVTPSDLIKAGAVLEDEVALDALRAIGFGKLERIFIRKNEKTTPYFNRDRIRI